MEKPVLLRAELRHCEWNDDEPWYGDVENVVEVMPVYYHDRHFDDIADVAWREKMRQAYSPARYIADCIAMTRNIAATWDLVSVTLDGIDVTDSVNAAWLRYYTSHRQDFV
jgi:hypothetical protein